MTRKASTHKHKTGYTSGPMFKLTKAQHDAINLSIRQSFAKMISGSFNQRQWVDMLTRMVVGKIMIAKFYTQETASEYEVCVQTLVDIELRAANKNHDVWDITEKEKEILEMGLDAVEVVQQETLRIDFLKAHREADTIITKMYIHKKNGIEKGLI